MIDFKKEIENSKIIFEDFNMPHPNMDRTTKEDQRGNGRLDLDCKLPRLNRHHRTLIQNQKNISSSQVQHSPGQTIEYKKKPP